MQSNTTMKMKHKVNNWVGYGSGSGKVDEFGLALFEPTDCKTTESLAGHMNPASFMYPMGADAFLVITDGVPEAHKPLPSAQFYDTRLSPITAGWKRGLAVIPPKVGIDRATIMVRKPVAGWMLKYSVESLDGSAVLWECEIDAGTDCGKNQVFEIPEGVTDGLAALFVEVIKAPKDQSCCNLVVAARVRINDYCHEDHLGMEMSCPDCDGCPTCDKLQGFTPIAS